MPSKALSPLAQLPNAPASCHWTEGWMDTLAFDLVEDWVTLDEAPRDWLPLRGSDARGACWGFHDHRYKAPSKLKTDQLDGDGKQERLIDGFQKAC